MRTDWDAVLERVIEALDLSDPVITDFQWPQQTTGEVHSAEGRRRSA